MVQLLNLVDCRTIYDEKTRPQPFESWYPVGMVSRDEVERAKRRQKQIADSKVVRLPLSEVVRIVASKR